MTSIVKYFELKKKMFRAKCFNYQLMSVSLKWKLKHCLTWTSWKQQSIANSPDTQISTPLPLYVVFNLTFCFPDKVETTRNKELCSDSGKLILNKSWKKTEPFTTNGPPLFQTLWDFCSIFTFSTSIFSLIL